MWWRSIVGRVVGSLARALGEAGGRGKRVKGRSFIIYSLSHFFFSFPPRHNPHLTPLVPVFFVLSPKQTSWTPCTHRRDISWRRRKDNAVHITHECAWLVYTRTHAHNLLINPSMCFRKSDRRNLSGLSLSNNVWSNGVPNVSNLIAPEKRYRKHKNRIPTFNLRGTRRVSLSSFPFS